MSAESPLQLARAIGEAVLGVPGVYSLGTGRYAEAATYGPGEKFVGVVVGDDAIEVHVVAAYPSGTPIPELASRVRERATRLARSKQVNVVVDDLMVTADEAV